MKRIRKNEGERTAEAEIKRAEFLAVGTATHVKLYPDLPKEPLKTPIFVEEKKTLNFCIRGISAAGRFLSFRDKTMKI